MKSISIVIVTWNCKKFIAECLDSLANYRADPQVEVIVVDNASEDGTLELVRESYRDVVLMPSEENLGFTKGNNVGIRKSSGRYLFLINPDVRVLNGCIAKMIAYMERNTRVGLLGPGMLGADGKSERSYMSRPTLWNLFCRALALDVLFPQSKLFSGYLMPYFDRKSTIEVDILNGWFWMTRREALDEVGLLDEALFMYADDLDWSKRFHDAGWKVVYFPEAESIHYGGGTTARAPIRFSVEMQRADFQYWKKNYGRASQLAYLCIVMLHQVIRLVGHSLLLLNPKTKREDVTPKIKRSLACIRWVFGRHDEERIRVQPEIQAETGSR
jgi:GT2 family glycosyltransferase